MKLEREGRPRSRRSAPDAGPDRARDRREERATRERLALVGIHTRGAAHRRRLHALVGELTGTEVPLGDLDISFYRDDLERREPSAQPVVHASHLDFELEGRTVVLVDDVLFTGRTVRAAIDALFDYGRPARVQLAVLVDRGHRELPIRPDYVGKNLPTAPRGAGQRPPRGDRRGRRGDDRAGAEAGPAREGAMKHLLAIDRLSSATEIERILRAGRELRRGRPARHQEGADPARAHHRQPLLRVEHPDQLLLRARRQAPLGRRRQRQVGRLLGRQGRVAEGHDRDPLRLRPRGDRDPLAARRRRATWSPRWTEAAVINAGDGKHEHPTPGAARRLHAARGGSSTLDRASDLDRRRRPPQPRRALLPARLPADGRRGDALRAPDADPARASRRSAARSPTPRRARRGRRRLRAAHAARADERELRPLDPRVRRALPDRLAPARVRASCSCTRARSTAASSWRPR